VAFLSDDDVIAQRDAERLRDFLREVIWVSACDGVGSPEGWLCIKTGHITALMCRNISYGLEQRLRLRQWFGDGAHPLAEEFCERAELAVLQSPDCNRMP
jgi:hypothetical protein